MKHVSRLWSYGFGCFSGGVVTQYGTQDASLDRFLPVSTTTGRLSVLPPPTKVTFAPRPLPSFNVPAGEAHPLPVASICIGELSCAVLSNAPHYLIPPSPPNSPIIQACSDGHRSLVRQHHVSLVIHGEVNHEATLLAGAFEVDQ